MKGYLGIDCGSTSIKAVILDEAGNLQESIYLRNKGIITTLKKSLASLNIDNYEIIGCGVTGSGREFTKVLVNADLAKTEIVAHAIATLTMHPGVNTIFEIGGEDSKMMMLRDGIIIDFRMNSICGGGTGAMIEAIATRLGIPIEDVGSHALQSTVQLELPGKCGIFCQSAVISKLNSGFKQEDILMGVCRALIRNYLAMCRGAPLKPPYIFQGATARNLALVKALEEELDHHVTVPVHCDLMGAIGIALLVCEEGIRESKFRLITDMDLVTRGFKCSDCANHCEVSQIYDGDNFIGAIGSRCGKWNSVEFIPDRMKQKDILLTVAATTG